MPTSRDMLAIAKLPEFIAFCQSKGWVIDPVNHDYEVLRMRNPKARIPLIVHTTANPKEHYTVSANSYRLARQFVRSDYGLSEEDAGDLVGDPVICNNCNGSGEGSYDGSTCRVCRGEGEV